MFFYYLEVKKYNKSYRSKTKLSQQQKLKKRIYDKKKLSEKNSSNPIPKPIPNLNPKSNIEKKTQENENRKIDQVQFFFETDEIKAIKHDSILEFQLMQQKIHHSTCNFCKIVSISNPVVTPNGFKHIFCCNECKTRKYYISKKVPYWLPIWFDDNQQIQYHLPNQLLGLREGEKLLIQLANTYVPLQHLKKGSHGCQGHVCCFPSDVTWIAKELPRKKLTQFESLNIINQITMTLNKKCLLSEKQKLWMHLSG